MYPYSEYSTLAISWFTNPLFSTRICLDAQESSLTSKYSNTASLGKRSCCPGASEEAQQSTDIFRELQVPFSFR